MPHKVLVPDFLNDWTISYSMNRFPLSTTPFKLMPYELEYI